MPPLRHWFPWLRIPLALIGVGLFFAGYNRFLLDRNLQNLKTSLSVLEAATGIGQAEAALLLVDQILVSEMAKADLDLKSLANLQYAQGVLSAERPQRPVEDAQIMVASLAETKAARRLGFLSPLDAMAVGMQTVLDQIQLLPRQLGRSPISPEIDSAQRAQAARWERQGMWKEAARSYEDLLSRYPNYAQRSGLKLRLGYLYQRLGDLTQAQRLYQQALAETLNPKELEAGRSLLGKLAQVPGQRKKAADLEKRLARVRSGFERQRLAFELGCLLIEQYALEKTAAVFQQAASASPEGELALPCLFKEAWCLRTSGRFGEAIERFLEIIHRDPKGRWGTGAYHQIAEVYKARGEFERAALTYERLIAETQDHVMAAVVHAQAGSTYLYDLKNPEKASGHFKELAEHYPASSLSSVDRILENIRTNKGITLEEQLGTLPAAATASPPPVATTPSAPTAGLVAMGAPLVEWMERFLPNFTDVFSDQLVRYMKGAGITELTRRFTETEFQELVLRRVQGRFAGQISQVATKIHTEGFVGSGMVHLGPLKIPVEARVRVSVVNERPHASVQEIKAGNLRFPEPILKALENKVNESVDTQPYPLKIKKYELREGEVLISVVLAK